MRRFVADDAGVNEVVGYILTFALSAIILLVSIQSFTLARENSDSVITGVELKTIATRVSTRVVEAGLMSQEFPNSTYTVVVQIPKDLNGHPYYIDAYNNAIIATAAETGVSASASTFRLEKITNLDVNGRVHSSEERVVIVYTNSTQPTITIRG